MSRPTGSKNIRTLEYSALYDKYADKYGCPVEALFKIAKNGRNPIASRITSYQTLVSYKFARPVQSQEELEQTELTLVWDETDNVKQING